MTFDVCIPVYNEENNIEKLLCSITKQELGNFKLQKILIYNDKSTDNTLKILQKFKKNEPKLFVMNAKINIGKAHGLNCLFKASRAEIQIILDSDIILTDVNCIYSILREFELNNNLGIANGWYNFSKSNTSISKVLEFSSELLVEIGKKNEMFTNWGGVQAIRNTVSSKIELPIKIHRIDGLLYIYTKRFGYDYKFINNVKVLDTKNFSELNFKWFCKIQKRATTTPELFNKILTSDEKLLFNVKYSVLVNALIKTCLRHPIKACYYYFIK